MWNVHNVSVDNADAWQSATVDALLDRIEDVVGRYPLGREPRLRCLCFTLEPWPPCHKPLIAYLSVGLGRRLLGLFLRWNGFELCRAGRLSYWVRPARESMLRPAPPTPQPLVLLHGVLGLLPYALLLRELARSHDGALLAPVFPHCSVQLEHLCSALPAAHDATELIAALRTMVARHVPRGTPVRAAFVAHSLGTGVLALLCRQSADLVCAAAFIDPICFLLPDGNVLRNYLYEPVALGLHTWFHWLQRYLVAAEPTQQDYFRSIFWWASSWLHPAELPCDALVLLSGRDTVAHAPRVFSYLQAWQSWKQLTRGHAHGQRAVASASSSSPARSPPTSPPNAVAASLSASPSPVSSTALGSPSVALHVHMHAAWSHGWVLFHPQEQRALVRRLLRMCERHSARHGTARHEATAHKCQRGTPPPSPRQHRCGSGALPESPPTVHGTPTTSSVVYTSDAEDEQRYPRTRQVRFTWESETASLGSSVSDQGSSCDEQGGVLRSRAADGQEAAETMWLQLSHR